MSQVSSVFFDVCVQNTCIDKEGFRKHSTFPQQESLLSAHALSVSPPLPSPPIF